MINNGKNFIIYISVILFMCYSCHFYILPERRGVSKLHPALSLMVKVARRDITTSNYTENVKNPLHTNRSLT